MSSETANILLNTGGSEVPLGYGTATKATQDDQEAAGSILASYDDSASYMLSELQERRRTGAPTFLAGTCSQPCWRSIGECIMVVANVDDVWDSPHPRFPVEFSSPQSYLAVLFWFFVLSASYALERSSFKVLVDRAGPFRLFSAEVISATYGLVLGAGVLASAVQRRSFEVKEWSLPLADIGLMAILDTVHLLLGVITGAYVAPTLTVILVQLTIPLTAFFTQFVHPDGACSRLCYRRSDESVERSPESNNVADDGSSGYRRVRIHHYGCGGLSVAHVWGATIIFVAVFLGLFPAFLSLQDPEIFVNQDAVPLRRAYNTIIFALACIPAAASQLYKEHVLLQYRQPMDGNSLNMVLSIFQFSIGMILSPLAYALQGLGAGSDWVDLYPPTETRVNFFDGLKCFLGVLDPDRAESAYPETAHCHYSLCIVIVHVFSTVLVGVAVDKIVHAGATKVMYRGISAGIILAILAMYVYEYFDPVLNYGPVVNSLHLACAVLLIVGSEVYHRVCLEDSTFETVYPDLDNLYEEEQ